MKLARTLLLVALLPALLMPSGVSICVCAILGSEASAACGGCCDRACPRHSHQDDAAARATTRPDCFVNLGSADPVRVDQARYAVVAHGATAPNLAPPTSLEPRLLALATSVAHDFNRWRVATTPLYDSALPLRL